MRNITAIKEEIKAPEAELLAIRSDYYYEDGRSAPRTRCGQW